MSNKLKLKESLSALMDSEVDDLELRRILKEIQHNSDQSEISGMSGGSDELDIERTWERYHLMSAVLKQEAHSNPKLNILSAVQAELKNDMPPIREKKGFSGFVTKLGQGAIAASVALMVLFAATNTETFTKGVAPSSEFEVVNVGNAEVEIDTLIFNGQYQASEFSHVVSSSSDSENQGHLIQAVYREFEELPETPVAPTKLNAPLK